MQDNVLAANTRSEFSVDLNLHVLTPLCDDGLGGQDVFYLAGTDTKGESTESAMCGCVTVTAYDCGAGQREALFRSDDVHDTLPLVVKAKVCEVEGLDILLESHAL